MEWTGTFEHLHVVYDRKTSQHVL